MLRDARELRLSADDGVLPLPRRRSTSSAARGTWGEHAAARPRASRRGSPTRAPADDESARPPAAPRGRARLRHRLRAAEPRTRPGRTYAARSVDGLQLPARVDGAPRRGGDRGRLRAAVLGRRQPRLDDSGPPARRGRARRAPTTTAGSTGIGDLGARVVRIYTILRPDFYDALAAYNEAHPEQPLFFIQGVWIPEEEFVDDGERLRPLGDGRLQSRDRGRRRGRPRRRDAAGAARPCRRRVRDRRSRWLLAFSIGIEWDPVRGRVDRPLNAAVKPYRGRYVTAGAPTPRRWRAGSRRCSTTRPRSTPRAAGAARSRSRTG